MRTPTTRRACAMLLSAAWLCSACTSQKLPAQQAVASVEGSLEAIRADAAQYFPDQLATVDAQVKTLKATLANGDYAGVLGEAPKLSGEIADLGTVVQQKATTAKLELSDRWSQLAGAVPDALQAVHSRIAALKKVHKLPKGVDASAATATWDKAKGAFAAGNLQEAVTAAASASDQVKVLSDKLKAKPSKPTPVTKPRQHH